MLSKAGYEASVRWYAVVLEVAPISVLLYCDHMSIPISFALRFMLNNGFLLIDLSITVQCT